MAFSRPSAALKIDWQSFSMDCPSQDGPFFRWIALIRIGMAGPQTCLPFLIGCQEHFRGASRFWTARRRGSSGVCFLVVYLPSSPGVSPASAPEVVYFYEPFGYHSRTADTFNRLKSELLDRNGQMEDSHESLCYRASELLPVSCQRSDQPGRNLDPVPLRLPLSRSNHSLVVRLTTAAPVR
jgi:hypothetical protein